MPGCFNLKKIQEKEGYGTSLLSYLDGGKILLMLDLNAQKRALFTCYSYFSK